MAKQVWAPENGDKVIRGDQEGEVVSEEDAVYIEEGNWQVYVQWSDDEDSEPDVDVNFDAASRRWIAGE